MSQFNRPRPFTARLGVELLEDRTTPAYAVQFTCAPIGIQGETTGQVINGGLQINPDLLPNAAGVVYIDTTSPAEAVRQAVSGSIDVAVNGTTTTYTFDPNTAQLTPLDDTAFVVAPGTSPPPSSSVTNWMINLEDLANFPAVSDGDFNDHYWTVRVEDVTDSYGGNSWFMSSSIATDPPPGDPPADPPPTLNLRVPTRNILINANNDNWRPAADPQELSRWKSDKQKYIPNTRDFSVSNLWQDDPQLVPITFMIGGGAGA